MGIIDTPHNLTNLTKVRNLTDLFVFSDTVVSNILGMGLLLLLWLILYGRMSYKHSSKESLVGSSFIVSLLSYFMAIIGILNPGFVIIPTIILAVSIIRK